MTDIATILSQARTKLTTWQAEAASAAASGASQTQSADAAWDAVAAIEAATNHAEGLRTQVLARNDTLAAALAARSAALAEAELARSDGGTPPLADATATALRGAVATAAGVTPATKLDGADYKTAVSTVDTAIAALDDTALNDLAAALLTLETKLQDYEDAEALAEAALTAAETAPAIIANDLHRALVQREAATTLASAGNKPAAVLAYVDYQAARSRLTAATAAAVATKLQTDWNTARDAQLSAAADLLSAQLAVIQGQLALARKRAEMTAKLATRDVVASAAVDAVLNPPAPPGP
ncbi:hypothetical protein [Zoogloea sp.]|uniref:hypothetical protein n=1 Tax=Zoogloea sp. TaxID=49181 RepID=UPI0025F81C5C|nr:hypothetical protein [Zoogloea sp.]